VTTKTVPDQAAIFGDMACGIDDGMPQLKGIELEFASSADLHRWAERFGVDVPPMSGQPYPLDAPSPSSWLVTELRVVRGLKVRLHCLEPISDEQRQHWVASGQAARREKYLAEQAAGQVSR
jgi:hypothetical protein